MSVLGSGILGGLAEATYLGTPILGIKSAVPLVHSPIQKTVNMRNQDVWRPTTENMTSDASQFIHPGSGKRGKQALPCVSHQWHHLKRPTTSPEKQPFILYLLSTGRRPCFHGPGLFKKMPKSDCD